PVLRPERVLPRRPERDGPRPAPPVLPVGRPDPARQPGGLPPVAVRDPVAQPVCGPVQGLSSGDVWHDGAGLGRAGDRPRLLDGAADVLDLRVQAGRVGVCEDPLMTAPTMIDRTVSGAPPAVEVTDLG